jgi:hypothetical protein
MDVTLNNLLTLFKGEVTERQLPVASAFEGIYLPQHHLLIHFISLTHPAVQQIEATYLSSLSDEASKKNIRLIHLWSDVYENNTMLVEARLLALIGKRDRVHARQTSVIRIDKKQADDFLNVHHLQQSTSAYYKYGLMHKDELIAVATFSKSRIMNDGPVLYRSYELVRFASKLGTTVTGGLGKLLKHFITEHHAVHMMTYADRDWSAGAGYEKLGFTLTEITPPQLFFIHPEQGVRYSQFRLPEGVTAEEMIDKGYTRIYNSGSLKYILDRR